MRRRALGRSKGPALDGHSHALPAEHVLKGEYGGTGQRSWSLTCLGTNTGTLSRLIAQAEIEVVLLVEGGDLLGGWAARLVDQG